MNCEVINIRVCFCIIKPYISNLVVQGGKCHNEVQQHLIRRISKGRQSIRCYPFTRNCNLKQTSNITQ